MLEYQKEYPDLRKYILDGSAQYCEEQKKKVSPLPDVSKKTGLAFWMAKDCSLTAGAKMRAKIAKELESSGLKIDGENCVSKKKSKKEFVPMKDSYDAMASYKFYLAFENSYHCKEYITEKVWYNSFYAGTVPVVWGGTKKDYIRLAPPKSFIFYEDYETPEDLINYLNYLDKNDTAYMEYFKWRKMFPCNYPLYRQDDTEEYEYAIADKYNSFVNAYCSMCKVLRDGLHLNRTRVALGLKDYWEKDLKPECVAR